MYARPDVEFREYRDDSGAVIPYGERWWRGSPAEASYSRSVHPERFDVTWTIARALVDHLVAEYDVDVTANVDPAEGRPLDDHVPQPRAPIDGAPPAVRRLVPQGAGSSITVIETAHPGAAILAGVTLAQFVPVCGWDACDESVDELADRLEAIALSVAYGTAVEEQRGRHLTHRVFTRHGSRGEGRLLKRRQRRAVTAAMKAAPAIAPWPTRASAG